MKTKEHVVAISTRKESHGSVNQLTHIDRILEEEDNLGYLSKQLQQYLAAQHMRRIAFGEFRSLQTYGLTEPEGIQMYVHDPDEIRTHTNFSQAANAFLSRLTYIQAKDVYRIRRSHAAYFRRQVFYEDEEELELAGSE